MKKPAAAKKQTLIERLKSLTPAQRRKIAIPAVGVSVLMLAIMGSSTITEQFADYARPANETDSAALAQQVRATKWDLCRMESPIRGIEVNRQNNTPLPLAAITAIKGQVTQCESIIKADEEQEARDRAVMERAALEDQRRLEAARAAAAAEEARAAAAQLIAQPAAPAPAPAPAAPQ
jgi:Na+-transporting methylmalonyl-CoA/oxaloacetate decarboxylase gamma subunit